MLPEEIVALFNKEGDNSVEAGCDGGEKHEDSWD